MDVVFERSIEEAAPPWLGDAEALIRDVDDLPQDAAAVAHTLGLSEATALLGIRRACGRVDLAARARLGAVGELALIGVLESVWPGSTVHVSLADDGFGYDLVVGVEHDEWHLEVKTTTRRGRLVIHLSRNEHNVGLLDSRWRLIVVGLNGAGCLAAVATVHYEAVMLRSPVDRSELSVWESVRHRLNPGDLQPGLGFLPHLQGPEAAERNLLKSGSAGGDHVFAWMPTVQ